MSSAVSKQDIRDENSSWPYTFYFESSQISKKRKPSFYIEKIERLYQLLMTMFDKCPVIKDFNHDFIVNIGCLRDIDYNEMTTNHGVIIRWPRLKVNSYLSIEEYFDPEIGRGTSLIIEIGLKAKSETMLQIRRLMLSLWKIFSAAFRIVYQSAGRPKSVWMRNQNFFVNCSDSSVRDWETKNEREHKFFTEAYRAFHPELKPAEIKPIIDEFTGQDSGLQKALKAFRKDEELKAKTGRKPYRLIHLINAGKKVELMADGRLNFHWEQNKYQVEDYMLSSPKTRNKEYIISDVTVLVYSCNLGLKGATRGYMEEKCKEIMQFCRDIATEVKSIVLEVDGPALKEFINRSVDFRELLPGLSVKVKVEDDEIGIWSWQLNHDHLYINQYPNDFDVKITDSFGTKTYHFKKVYHA